MYGSDSALTMCHTCLNHFVQMSKLYFKTHDETLAFQAQLEFAVWNLAFVSLIFLFVSGRYLEQIKEISVTYLHVNICGISNNQVFIMNWLYLISAQINSIEVD